jgi:hypothetical protein
VTSVTADRISINSETVLGLPGVRVRLNRRHHTEMTGLTVCETRWAAIISSFEGKHDELLEEHPDCTEELALLRTGLQTIGHLIHVSPPANGNGRPWKELVAKAEAERAVLCKHLEGKALFTAMLRLYAATHRELRDSVVSANLQPSEEFREQRR